MCLFKIKGGTNRQDAWTSPDTYVLLKFSSPKSTEYISWEWWFIYAYILKATCCCRCFHWRCFDNSIYPRDIIHIKETEGLYLIIHENGNL